MGPSESLVEDLRQHVHPDKADRTIRDYIKGCVDRGLASVEGRYVELTPPSEAIEDSAEMEKRRKKLRKSAKQKTREDWRESATDLQESARIWRKSAGENLPGDGENLQKVGENLQKVGENLPTQLIPPVPPGPPVPPSEGSALPLPGLGFEDQPQDPTDDELIAQFWREYNAERADAWARWRPSHRVEFLGLTDKRRKKLLALCRSNAPKGATTAELLAVARKVVRIARRELDRDRGRVMDSGWDSMRRLADYWFRKEHFDRMANEPELAVVRSTSDYAPRYDDDLDDDPIALQGLLDDGGHP